ncbi:hypothetical protein F5Y18DRAFT_394839 [Xylariaceae sp. FL1019]|nr:hypothetical protein F5Y18DRAFT_394839 [Xylariaceae sp. FL1019]
MTIDTTRPVDGGRGHHALEDDILAALWENAPFPRLPFDAPPEIRDLVVDIENPKKVYTIHRASRRHNLQLLVEKFVHQLRYGCGSNTCSTASCFTYRKRAAGRAPIRRYNPNSARTLAVYLASQDNPETRLCPYLQPPNKPSDSLKPLIFAHKLPPSTDATKPRLSPSRKSSSTPEISPVRHRSSSPLYTDQHGYHHATPLSPRAEATPPSSSRREDAQPHMPDHDQSGVKKDYRSFAANVFGTVAFKMLEWLTPNSIEALQNDMEWDGEPPRLNSASAQHPLSSDGGSESRLASPTTSPPSWSRRSSVDGAAPIANKHAEQPQETNAREAHDRRNGHVPPERPSVTTHNRSPHARRKSNAKIRTSSGPKPPSKLVVESIKDGTDEKVLGSPDRIAKGLVLSSPALRTAFESSSDDFFDVKVDQTSSGFDVHDSPTTSDKAHRDGVNGDDGSSEWGETRSTESPNEGHHNDAISEPQSELDSYLPQSLSRLSLEAVNFICDVLQDDATAERHLLEPPTISGSLRRSSGRRKSWRRKRKPQISYPQDLKYQWKLFVEQSIFNVLSDPRAVLESFTSCDGTIDSQTLWYCMLRLTRAAPQLVFDSLWIALASLFAPPLSLQSPRSPSAKVFGSSQNALSNVEAASLISICFHALVAAAPLVTDSRQLHDMSRIRSHGLTLIGSGTVARQPSSVCLDYEDVFTDDLALRLAKRLLTAISTRCYFDELARLDLDRIEDSTASDVLDIILSQIEPSMQSRLHFSRSERTVHEKRVPILLLDWARAVMVQEWAGKPDVSGDGPLGGALMLIGAMYQKRQSLLLGDAHFRSEYFGDRLDTVEMPVSWLNFESTRQRVHLLDYPYTFNPASLVTYFRAINYSRMSRSHEESILLESQIKYFIGPGGLETGLHQRDILEDMLKTPTAKYLILDIRREDVLADAFDQLWRREERELMRPLKIHLGEDSGEEGFDSGGVQQEFFRLAIAEALNPDYGAFTVEDRTRMTWFQPGSLQPEWRYELVGLIVSLAVYNGLTLPVTFPKALYHRLLGEPVTELHHIADGWPELASGLTNLLEWNEADGAVEDVFVLTYEFSTSMFGQPVTRQMDPTQRQPWPQLSSHSNAEPLSADNPTDAPPVTGDNRNAYVSDYIRYLTDISVEPQFAAFERGFRTCLHPKSLSLLTPALLQSIVEGTQEINISELKRAVRYVGWDAGHSTIRDFWAVVKTYDERMRRKLLEFVTASDRVPVGGVQNVQFVIQRNGAEDEGGHLPTAYTCYGTLLLPEYPDRDVLRERLGMAIENAQGFGFA